MIGIGYDIGSSFVKAALVDVETGRPIARVRVPEVEISIDALQIGWAEQHPAPRPCIGSTRHQPDRISGWLLSVLPGHHSV